MAAELTEIGNPATETATTLRAFDRSLPMALMRAREATMLRFRPLLGRYGLTEQQWRVLRSLHQSDDPLDVGQIADRTFLLGPSLSRILVNLEERSFIRRRQSPQDQRRSLVSLRPAGRRLVETVAPHSEAVYTEIERILGPDRLEVIVATLEELAATAPPPDCAGELGEAGESVKLEKAAS